MPKKVLKLKATLNKGYTELQLVDIVGVSPFSFNVFSYNYNSTKVRVDILNGHTNGRGIGYGYYSNRATLTIYNGKPKGNNRFGRNHAIGCLSLCAREEL